LDGGSPKRNPLPREHREIVHGRRVCAQASSRQNGNGWIARGTRSRCGPGLVSFHQRQHSLMVRRKSACRSLWKQSPVLARVMRGQDDGAARRDANTSAPWMSARSTHSRDIPLRRSRATHSGGREADRTLGSVSFASIPATRLPYNSSGPPGPRMCFQLRSAPASPDGTDRADAARPMSITSDTEQGAPDIRTRRSASVKLGKNHALPQHGGAGSSRVEGHIVA